MLRVVALMMCVPIAAAAGPAPRAGAVMKPEGVLFSESFEDSDLAKRGWYDGTQFRLAGDAMASSGSIEYEWTEGLGFCPTPGQLRSPLPSEGGPGASLEN